MLHDIYSQVSGHFMEVLPIALARNIAVEANHSLGALSSATETLDVSRFTPN